MDQIRILHIQRMSAISGSEKYIRDLSIAQQRAGYSVAVVIACSPSDYNKLDGFAKDLREKGIEVFILYSVKWYSRKLITSLASLCRQWKPSLVHTHLLYADLYAALVKKFSDPTLKIVSTKHGFQEEYVEQYGMKVTGRLKKMPFYWVSRWVEKKIDLSYTVSRAMSVFFHKSRITRDEIPVIYHGLTKLATSKCESLNQREISPLLIVSVGRLAPLKGYNYLIRAVAILKQKFPGVQLKIIGGGVMRQELESLTRDLDVNKNVSFLGFQSQPELFLQDAAVIAIPTLVEAFGLVFLEAMAYEKAIVAFDTPAGNEIVRNQQTGLLVKIRDFKAMAAAIEKLLVNPSLASELGKNGRALLCREFTFERVMTEVDQLYRSVLDK